MERCLIYQPRLLDVDNVQGMSTINLDKKKLTCEAESMVPVVAINEEFTASIISWDVKNNHSCCQQ